VFDRVANDVSIRQRLGVALEEDHEEVNDIGIGPFSEYGIRIGSGAHSELLDPTISVVAGHVVDADPCQVMSGSLFEG